MADPVTTNMQEGQLDVGDLCRERLRFVVSYAQETGLFVWVNPTAGQHQPGDPAGGPSHGYIRVMIDGRRYSAHRLAWLYINGEWPDGHIDHINGNRSDNRIANLRIASRSENAANTSVRKNNRAGLKGVSYHKASRKFRAQIMRDGIKMDLGGFLTPEAAHLAYTAAANEHFGQFARPA